MRMPAGALLGITLALSIASLTVACGKDDLNREGATTATTPPTTETPVVIPAGTPVRSVQDIVSDAYLAYWDAYTQAVFKLDESRIGETMTGPILERTRAEIADLRQRGRAVRIDVEHRFVVVDVNEQAGTATVVDEYTNRSYLVDPVTKQPTGTIPAGSRVADTYFMIRMDERWKVRDGVRSTGN